MNSATKPLLSRLARLSERRRFLKSALACTLPIPACSASDLRSNSVVNVAEYAESGKKGQTQAFIEALRLASGGTLVFPEGNWYINGDFNNGMGLSPAAHTTIVIESGARLLVEPMNLSDYRMFSLREPGIHITGQGELIGDLLEHSGDDGDQGHGIFVGGGADGWQISGISAKLFWGDAILVGDGPQGGPARNGIISDVVLSDCRRNNLSVTWCDGLVIERSQFSLCGFSEVNVRGKHRAIPSSGIDFETDEWSTVRNVSLFDCTASDNLGNGFTVQDPHAIQETDSGTVAVEFYRCHASGNGYLEEPHMPEPLSGIDVLEGGNAYFEDCSSNNNIGAGLTVTGAVGGRTGQGVVSALNLTTNNNLADGIRFQNDAIGGENKVRNLKATGNGQGSVGEYDNIKFIGGSGNSIVGATLAPDTERRYTRHMIYISRVCENTRLQDISVEQSGTAEILVDLADSTILQNNSGF